MKITSLIAWNHLYSLKSYTYSALWVVPVGALLVEQVMLRVMIRINDWLVSTGRLDLATGFYGLSASNAQTTLGFIFTMNMSFIVFTFGSLLVAIQVAGGQYTPRIIATTLLRDNVIRYTVGYFIITMLFSVGVHNAATDTAPQFLVFFAALLGFGSIVSFLYLIDYAARMLRPVSLVVRLAENGIEVINSVYPKTAKPPRASRLSSLNASLQRIVTHVGNSGIVLAANLKGLLAEARRVNGIIELVPQIGDFVAVDEPLFRLYDGAGAIDDRLLRSSIALGSERSIEQDSTFAFRIIVDIALKALSPAINDPTTATLAIDQLHRLLRMVGMRHLYDDEIKDDNGQLRVIMRTPDWRDFVHLSFREIRQCGAGSIQIARRLRAMLENLLQTLPEYRHPELRTELELLDRAIKERFLFPEDLALASIPDVQGMGGSERPKNDIPDIGSAGKGR